MSPGFGPEGLFDVGANVDAKALADRPPGRDCMFSLWVSIMSKLITSSIVTIFKGEGGEVKWIISSKGSSNVCAVFGLLVVRLLLRQPPRL